MKIFVFALTGGPCGGKTTALCFLEEKLRELGYAVFVVKEAATKLMEAGLIPGKTVSLIDFQKAILHDQCFNERLYKEAPIIGDKKGVVILCDRGIMDIKAYIEEKGFRFLLDTRGMSEIEVRDGRYDAVFHLRSLGYDRPDLYRKLWTTNPMRSENTPEKARELDEKTLRAWEGHEHRHILDNRDDFEKKKRKLLECVCHELGIPQPLEIERAFLVEKPVTPTQWNVSYQEILIEQAYLEPRTPDIEERVRSRTQNMATVYYRTEKKDIRPSVRAESEEHISSYEYYRALAYRDPLFHIIKKTRCCFTWNNQCFVLDRFVEPHPGLHRLEIELTKEQQEVVIPPFIRVVREVTHDPAFKNRELARIRR